MKLTTKLSQITQLQEYLENKKEYGYDAFVAINTTAQKVTHSDRSTFFIFNRTTNRLESYIAQGLPVTIDIGLGEGIVGSCAQSKTAMIENDVDATKDFNPDIDLGSGYVTRNTLTVPILDTKENLLGVIQVLNKEQGYYDETDEQLLLKIAQMSVNYMQHI